MGKISIPQLMSESLTCKEIWSPYLQLEVKLIINGVDGLLLQE